MQRLAALHRDLCVESFAARNSSFEFATFRFRFKTVLESVLNGVER